MFRCSNRVAPALRGALVAVSAAAAAGTACAGAVEPPPQIGGAYSVPARSLKEARYSATIRQQFDFSCGSAALATLLSHHYGDTVTEERVFEEMFRHGDQDKIRREGFSLLDMKRYLEGRGYAADGFEAPLATLAEERVPAIVLINENGYNHFVVVKGLRDGRVLLGDPAGGTRAMTVEAFVPMWVNGILFVVTDRREQARFDADADWRVAPTAPLARGLHRDGLAGVVLPKFGPSDF